MFRQSKAIIATTVCVSLLSVGGILMSEPTGRSPFLEVLSTLGMDSHDGDTTNLDLAISRAQRVGFSVDKDETIIRTVPQELRVETLKDINEDYDNQAAEIQRQIDAHLDESETDEEFEKRKRDFERDLILYEEAETLFPGALDDYEKELKLYEESVETQITNADPFTALTPDRLAVEQPFTLEDSRSTLRTPKGFTEDSGPSFSSDKSFSVKGDSITSESSYSFEWRSMAVDKESGRPLNAQVTVDSVVVDDSVDRDDEGEPMIQVYSNYSDNISINGITSLRQKVTLTYEDGTPYDKQYYITVGSLNAQGKNGERREFASPGDGVKASFVNQGSRIPQEAQEVSGSASGSVKRAFMVSPEGQGGSISDSSPKALEEIGVTFLVDNEASFFTGVSGSNGKPPTPISTENSLTGGAIRTTYNHVMMSSNTVAETVRKPVKPEQPIKPTAPTRSTDEPGTITYRLHRIVEE